MRLPPARLLLPLSLSLSACAGGPDGGVKVFNSDPTANILSHVDGDRVPDGVEVELRGVVGDQEDDYLALSVLWLIDGAAACSQGPPMADGTTSCAAALSSSGRGEVVLQVVDTAGAGGSAKVTLEVVQTTAPTVRLDEPRSDRRHYVDVPLTFSGFVDDAESPPGELTVSWTSDRDGALSIPAADAGGTTQGTAYLTEGNHIIELRATDPQGNAGFTSTFVQVGPPNTPPSCGWTAPDDGGLLRRGDVALLQATASDPDIDATDLRATFSSDVDGELGAVSPDSAGAISFGVSSLSLGLHTLRLTVEDDAGTTCVADRVVRVAAPPAARISSPTPGSSVNAGETVSFAATATDAEDAAPDLIVLWESDLDGPLDAAAPDASGALAFFRELSIGNHRITLTVTDTDGFSSAALTTVEVIPCAWYYDGDFDGYGDPAQIVETCVQPAGYVADATDCDDRRPAVNPGATELCDGLDNDCDTVVDEPDAADAPWWYPDVDGDTYGDLAAGVRACSAPGAFISTGLDCDDGDPAISPVADEVCGDGVDDDCDGADLACILNIPLSSASLQLWGESARDGAGNAVAGGGDVDGDGLDDVLVGASLEDASALDVGVGYLVLGGISGTLDLSLADARMYGNAREDYAGTGVSIVGDLDGDGYDDVAIGAPGDDTSAADAGAVYLLYGPVSGSFDLDLADAVLLGGAAGQQAGTSVAGLGDVDGDGLADLIVGAPGDDGSSRDMGKAFFVKGSGHTTTGLGAAYGRYQGELSDDLLGTRVAAAGDVDGDGVNDLLMSAPPEDSGGNASGSAYIVLGTTAGGDIGLRYADKQLTGTGVNHFAGRGLAGAGDLDGDGYDEVLIGADGEDTYYTDGGAAYIWAGQATVRGTASLSGAATTFIAEHDLQGLGYSVSGLGDVNADGWLDLVLGALGDETGASGAGAAYVALGPHSAGVVTVSDLYARLIGGVADDSAGWAVGTAGDFNGDGYDDVLVGAPAQDFGGTDAGAAYVHFGALSW
jgi:hypothetical protein